MSKETDVVLVYPKVRLDRPIWEDIRIPLGLLAIATPLDIAGYKVKIIDQRVEKNWKKILLDELEKEPLCVGISCMSGPQIKYALEISRLVRENSTVPIVWGGVHPSLLPFQTLKNDFVDIVVQGEGEETFYELVRALKDKSTLNGIKGIWYKEDGKLKRNPPRPFIDLNQQPFLSYHLLDIEKYRNKRYGQLILSFSTSRGCYRECPYCYNTAFNKKKWRYLTVEESLKRLKKLISAYQPYGILLTDDNFFVDLNVTKRFLEGIIKQKINIRFFRTCIHPEDLIKMDNNFLKLLERAGVVFLVIGVESGSQRILNLLRKNFDVTELIKINKKLSKFSFRVVFSFMLGLPFETKKDISLTVFLIHRLLAENKKARVSVNIYTPYPGTELFDLSVKNGLIPPQTLEEWIPFAYHTANNPWLSEERKKMLYMLCFCSGCFSPYFLKKFVRVSKKNYGAKLKYFFILILIRLYQPIARLRMVNLYYKFPIEIKIARFFGYYRPLKIKSG